MLFGGGILFQASSQLVSTVPGERSPSLGPYLGVFGHLRLGLLEINSSLKSLEFCSETGFLGKTSYDEFLCGTFWNSNKGTILGETKYVASLRGTLFYVPHEKGVSVDSN